MYCRQVCGKRMLITVEATESMPAGGIPHTCMSRCQRRVHGPEKEHVFKCSIGEAIEKVRAMNYYGADRACPSPWCDECEADEDISDIDWADIYPPRPKPYRGFRDTGSRFEQLDPEARQPEGKDKSSGGAEGGSSGSSEKNSGAGGRSDEKFDGDCGFCGKRGHRQHDCWQRQAQGGQPSSGGVNALEAVEEACSPQEHPHEQQQELQQRSAATSSSPQEHPHEQQPAATSSSPQEHLRG